nr:hypothetical protein [uncultured Halomonas sp.]
MSAAPTSKDITEPRERNSARRLRTSSGDGGKALMPPTVVIEPLDKTKHASGDFSSGVAQVDCYLKDISPQRSSA